MYETVLFYVTPCVYVENWKENRKLNLSHPSHQRTIQRIGLKNGIILVFFLASSVSGELSMTRGRVNTNILIGYVEFRPQYCLTHTIVNISERTDGLTG